MEIKEKISFNISDERDPERALKFFAVLEKRGANQTDVARRLFDAYIESDGAVPFPVVLVAKTPRRI